MPKLIAPQLRQAEFVYNRWFATPPAGTTKADVLAPAFWTHVQAKVKAGDRIDVTPESGEWLAELLVRAAGENGLVLHVLHYHAFAAAELPAGSDYEVKFGGAAKWRVIRKADRHVLVESLPTREAAEAWLAGNSKTDLV